MEDFEQEGIADVAKDVDAEPEEQTEQEHEDAAAKKRRRWAQRKRDQRQRAKSLATNEPIEETWKRNLEKLTDAEFNPLWARHEEAGDIRFWLHHIRTGIAAGLRAGDGMDDDSAELFMPEDLLSVYDRVVQHIARYGKANYPESLDECQKVDRDFIDVVRYHKDSKAIMAREPEFWRYGFRLKMQSDAAYRLLLDFQSYVQQHGISAGPVFDLVEKYAPSKPASIKWVIRNGQTIPAKIAEAYDKAGVEFLTEAEKDAARAARRVVEELHAVGRQELLTATKIRENAERLRHERETGF